MSRINCTVVSDEVTLVANTAKTIIILTAAAQHRIAVKGFSLTMKGIAPTNEPGIVEFYRTSTAGTSTAATPKRLVPGSETIQTIAGVDATVEPTLEAGQPMRRVCIHPQGGHVEKWGPDDEIILAGGERLTMRAKFDDAVTLIGELYFEE